MAMPLMSEYVVIPIRFAGRFIRDPLFDPWAEMRPKEVILCKRLMVQHERQEVALEKWHTREIDDNKR